MKAISILMVLMCVASCLLAIPIPQRDATREVSKKKVSGSGCRVRPIVKLVDLTTAQVLPLPKPVTQAEEIKELESVLRIQTKRSAVGNDIKKGLQTWKKIVIICAAVAGGILVLVLLSILICYGCIRCCGKERKAKKEPEMEVVKS